MRLAIYARVSTGKQDNENQLADLRRFARKQGWTIVKEYVDTVTGSGKKAREQFDAMMLAASKREFDCVLFWKLDRFSREGVRRTLFYLTQLDGWKVGWRSFQEQWFDSCIGSEPASRRIRKRVGAVGGESENKRKMDPGGEKWAGKGLMRPDNYDDLSLLQRFVDSGTAIYLPEGRVDPSDLLLTMVRAGVAGKERKEMLERAWSAKEEKRKRGELAQSRIVLPWGVDYQDGVWSYKPAEAERVRRAYRRVLRGEINYRQIAAQLDVTPRGAALILQNPIWKGWRILDKKRDPSAKGRYKGKDGRQADRKKITRSEADIIRVQVIKDPLLSEAEWGRAQQIMARKRVLHWRTRKDYVPRFTYAGFLTCAACGQPVHTANQRGDVYVCRGRRLAPHSCQTAYMKRETLEAVLDRLFADKLTSPKFVARCIEQLRRERDAHAGERKVERLEEALARLSAKRARILDTYLEGVLSQEDRDARLAVVDRDLAATRAQLQEAAGAPTPGMKSGLR